MAIVILVGVIPQSLGSGFRLNKINLRTLIPKTVIVEIITNMVPAVIAVIILSDVSVFFADTETIKAIKNMKLQTEYDTHARTWN